MHACCAGTETLGREARTGASASAGCEEHLATHRARRRSALGPDFFESRRPVSNLRPA